MESLLISLCGNGGDMFPQTLVLTTITQYRVPEDIYNYWDTVSEVPGRRTKESNSGTKQTELQRDQKKKTEHRFMEEQTNKQTNSVAFIPQENYTD
jgi:hypothetical protein